MWSRYFALQPEAAACPVLNKSLTALGAERMVVGHTIQAPDTGAPGIGRMRQRCGGRLVLSDTGSSRAYDALGLGSDSRAAVLRLPRPAVRPATARPATRLPPAEPLHVHAAGRLATSNV